MAFGSAQHSMHTQKTIGVRALATQSEATGKWVDCRENCHRVKKKAHCKDAIAPGGDDGVVLINANKQRFWRPGQPFAQRLSAALCSSLPSRRSRCRL